MSASVACPGTLESPYAQSLPLAGPVLDVLDLETIEPAPKSVWTATGHERPVFLDERGIRRRWVSLAGALAAVAAASWLGALIAGAVGFSTLPTWRVLGQPAATRVVAFHGTAVTRGTQGRLFATLAPRHGPVGRRLSTTAPRTVDLELLNAALRRTPRSGVFHVAARSPLASERRPESS